MKAMLIICIVFILRLFVVNLSASDFTSHQTQKLLSEHFSTILKKRRKGKDTSIQTSTQDSSIQGQGIPVIIGEDDDENEPVKLKNVYLLNVFFSFLKEISVSAKSKIPFDFIKCSLFPKKYLAISVLRI